MNNNYWINGETVYYPSFDNIKLYDQWAYHNENEAVQALIMNGVAFKSSKDAIRCAKHMLKIKETKSAEK